MTVSWRTVSLISATLIGLATTSCGNAGRHPSGPPIREPVAYSYANVWSAEPNIDLSSRGAELIRATIESEQMIPFVGVESAYPGFMQAAQNSNEAKRGILENSNDHFQQPVGVTHEHILNYSADNSIVTATVCSIETSASRPVKPLFVNNSMSEYTVELRNTRADPGFPGLPDTGGNDQHLDPRYRAPNWNVFGTWEIGKLSTVASGSDIMKCLAWWPEYSPKLTYDAETGVYFPPGFTDFGEPVKAQYPKWIAPANGG